MSQETLAETIGATRSRVNFFMNKFRRLGLVEYNGGLKINSSSSASSSATDPLRVRRSTQSSQSTQRKTVLSGLSGLCV